MPNFVLIFSQKYSLVFTQIRNNLIYISCYIILQHLNLLHKLTSSFLIFITVVILFFIKDDVIVSFKATKSIDESPVFKL